VLAYTDETIPNSAVPVRFHDGSIYRVCNFEFVGYSQPMPHWVDILDGARYSTKQARARHGTRSIAAIGKLAPTWDPVPAAPKQLWAYPMALTVEDALARVAAAPSGRALYTGVQALPRRIWE
jgi:hypothetical protein